MANKLFRGKRMSKNDGLYNIIKNSIKKYLDAETTTHEGKINLISGLVLVLVFFIAMVPNIVEIILEFFRPECDIGMPWYVLFLGFIILVGFFTYCMMNVFKIKQNDYHSKQD